MQLQEKQASAITGGDAGDGEFGAEGGLGIAAYFALVNVDYSTVRGGDSAVSASSRLQGSGNSGGDGIANDYSFCNTLAVDDSFISGGWEAARVAASPACSVCRALKSPETVTISISKRPHSQPHQRSQGILGALVDARTSHDLVRLIFEETING